MQGIIQFIEMNQSMGDEHVSQKHMLRYYNQLRRAEEAERMIK